MNWDQVQGKWKQVKGSVKQQWGKLTDDDLEVIDGQKDKLVGRLQERYGITKEEAARQVQDWSPRTAATSDTQHASDANKDQTMDDYDQKKRAS
jgi:uncharacterized protein YjbJ (UPF0337 family)